MTLPTICKLSIEVSETLALSLSCTRLLSTDSGRYSAFSILDNLNTQHLAAVMEGPNGNDVDAIVKAKDLYQSCMNTNLTNELGLQPLLDVLALSGKYMYTTSAVIVLDMPA